MVPDSISFHSGYVAAATSGKLTEEWREEKAISDEWKQAQLGDVARDLSYGSSAKSSKSGVVPVLRMGNIQDGRLNWSDLVYTSDTKEIAKYELALGDVLFNRTNSPELVGKTAVFKGERESVYAGYLIRVRCSPQLLPDYLNYCLSSPAGRDYCWQVKSDGVSQSNINAKKLAAFGFLLPSVEEQTEIVRRVESLFAYVDRLEARYAAARAQVENSPRPRSPKPFAANSCRKTPTTNRPAYCWHASAHSATINRRLENERHQTIPPHQRSSHRTARRCLRSEKLLQTLIENNLEPLLGIRFLATEYSTGENVINLGLFVTQFAMEQPSSCKEEGCYEKNRIAVLPLCSHRQ